jgi:prepilin-type N-terminal cleavage/methylation domain-containing protein
MWVKHQSGFTIVELLVTTVIAGLVITAITSLFITIEASQRSTQLLETANRAAEQQVEALRNNNYNALQPGTNITFTNDLPSNLPAPKSGIAAISEPVTGLRRVDVTISYKDGSSTKQVKLSSLIGQIGISQ